MFKDRPLEVPEHCQHELSVRGLWLEFFEYQRWHVLPLYALPFGFPTLSANEGVNFSSFNTFCPQKSYNISLFFFGARWKMCWHVCNSVATHTLRKGTSYSQGQTTRVRGISSPSLCGLSHTISVQTKKCENFLKCPRKYGVMTYKISGKHPTPCPASTLHLS
jgi:hypothetical protein